MRPSRQMKRISVSKSPTFTGQVREVFHQDTPAQGQRLAARLIQRLPACPIPEIARLGRTLRKWKDALDAYVDTDGASNGPTEAINGQYRTRQTHRQKLPQPHQLPTPNAPHHRRPRRLHPHSTMKSRLSESVSLAPCSLTRPGLGWVEIGGAGGLHSFWSAAPGLCSAPGAAHGEDRCANLYHVSALLDSF